MDIPADIREKAARIESKLRRATPIVGADYSALTDDQLNESDPEMDDLLRRSRVISEKRGL